MTNKVKLASLQVKSFVTNLDGKTNETIKGGATNSCYGGSGGAPTCLITSCVIH